MEEQEKTQSQEVRSRYRSGFAATVLFSGVQIYQIIILIVKSKFVALFIGPVGMGIQSLLHTTTETISAATNLGLKTSSVKTIAAANREGDRATIAKTVSALRRLIWITGLIGMLICAAFAPIWSNTSFGSNAYVWSFVAVSAVVLFEQLNKGELALLQGMQQKQKLAQANVIGQTINALITIPLYYFYGLKAIAVALVLGSLISLLISTYYSHKLSIAKVNMSWRETFAIGHEMMKLGFFLSLQYLMATVVVWIIRNYVSSTGGLDQVGLYGAGTAIVTTYIGLVFSAIATDYYPRLAATKSNAEMIDTVHVQAELTILLLAPLVVAFIVFCKPFIIILYSSKFLPVEHMMYWSIGAVLLQAMGWAASYTLLAKAKPLYFFYNELITTAWSLPVKLLFYKYWGLTGFGAATMLVYGLYLIQIMIVAKKIFGFSFSQDIWKLLFLTYVPVVGAVLLKLCMPEAWGYLTGIIILIITSLFVFLKLDKIMDIKSVIAKYRTKIKR